MKLLNLFVAILLLIIFTCKADFEDFEYESNLQKGLAKSKEEDKPLFLCFSTMGIGYDEFRYDLITSSRVQNKLKDEFVSVLLYVDDKRKVEVEDTSGLERLNVSNELSEKLKRAKNKGNVNARLQWNLFMNNSQPFYVILNSEGGILYGPFSYQNRNPKTFLSILERGLENYNQQKQEPLDSTLQEIIMEYYGFMCDCPQWISPENEKIYKKALHENHDSIINDSAFQRMIPNSVFVENPFDLTNDTTDKYLFKFEGRYYKEKLPWTSEDGTEYFTRVFKYDNCELIINKTE